jgi:DNA-binding transcriptional LysR family regulator
MTLTQLNAFVLVARLGSVTAAANALGVSEPAVSQALSALRQHLGDQLLTRGPAGMTLTAGGSRLLSSASQIVVLGAEAHAAVRAAQGAPEQLRVVATSTVAEFVIGPLMEAFTRRFPGSVEVSVGVAVTKEMGVLVANRLADVAISPSVADDPALAVVSEPIFRYRVVVVTAGQSSHRPVAGDAGDPGRQHRRVPQPDRGLGGGGRRRGCGTGGRAPGGPAAAPGRAVPGGRARRANRRLLARQHAGPPAPQRRHQRAPALPRHAGGDAPDALARGGRAAVPVPATGVRNDLELGRAPWVYAAAQRAGGLRGMAQPPGPGSGQTDWPAPALMPAPRTGAGTPRGAGCGSPAGWKPGNPW